MKWITRKDVKVDRVACPWLIMRFVDPQAEFLFVQEKDLLDKSTRQGATPFDAPKIEAISHPSIAECAVNPSHDALGPLHGGADE